MASAPTCSFNSIRRRQTLDTPFSPVTSAIKFFTVLGHASPYRSTTYGAACQGVGGVESMWTKRYQALFTGDRHQAEKRPPNNKEGERGKGKRRGKGGEGSGVQSSQRER